ncbi:Hg(II)-responsive transcriptional regulator [Edaphobacter albus]|uniref:Hg(II)-responsive transcriptional regulator n=1 Tax=Edaphobacter sp. 4G125 TaxID=2763071 RepID=UPI0016487176|nr:Hg(II)-responsive transcriptional regulator [Edaphobacter sp. 4G125]QNI38035.1 Hg(II)-responsive transcriptional regulator [Edaphobacter sp. 4G125]
MPENLTIGMLAKRGGVNVETIRYYQRRGLLQEPLKPYTGFRQYPPQSVRRIRFIKRAQSLGFTLEEIHGLLALDERRACRETRGMAAHKLELIEEKLADLSTMKKALSRLVRACDASSEGTPCPIIHLLADD